MRKFDEITAQELVAEYVHKADASLKFNTHVVWACKTLQNFKAIVITDQKDNTLFEVTYNGDKDEAYIDQYVKQTNTLVRFKE